MDRSFEARVLRRLRNAFPTAHIPVSTERLSLTQSSLALRKLAEKHGLLLSEKKLLDAARNSTGKPISLKNLRKAQSLFGLYEKNKDSLSDRVQMLSTISAIASMRENSTIWTVLNKRAAEFARGKIAKSKILTTSNLKPEELATEAMLRILDFRRRWLRPGLDFVRTKDRNGNEIRREYRDLDGKLTLNEEKIAGWKSEFDKNGKEIERLYFGLSGQVTLSSHGVAGWRIFSDPQGHEERRFVDANGTPVGKPACIPGAKRQATIGPFGLVIGAVKSLVRAEIQKSAKISFLSADDGGDEDRTLKIACADADPEEQAAWRQATYVYFQFLRKKSPQDFDILQRLLPEMHGERWDRKEFGDLLGLTPGEITKFKQRLQKYATEFRNSFL
jgi:hypothetical protein